MTEPLSEIPLSHSQRQLINYSEHLCSTIYCMIKREHKVKIIIIKGRSSSLSQLLGQVQGQAISNNKWK